MQGGTRGRNALTDDDPGKSHGTGSVELPGIGGLIGRPAARVNPAPQDRPVPFGAIIPQRHGKNRAVGKFRSDSP